MAFVLPPYPYDRLEPAKRAASLVPGGLVDLSVGTPCDPPPPAVIHAMATSDTERGYPTSLGSPALRAAAAGWIARRLGATVDPAKEVAACIGTKEFVATTPQYLRLLRADKDTVLYPAVSYPTYEMGALLAGCRAVAVPVDEQWRLRLDAIDPADAARALCLWVNAPGNPAGNLDDLAAAAAWGRQHGVPVLSDECYVEFTWDGPRRTILTEGTDGVLAVHSLSKRSNLAGARVGFYAGDPTLVHFLAEVRKHAGFMVPGPIQAAGAVAYADDEHVDVQYSRYRSRLERFLPVLAGAGFDVAMPGGAFYLWAAVPGGDGWAAADWLAAEAGILVSPGDFYGTASSGYVRVAMVQPDAQLDLAAERLAAAGTYRPSTAAAAGR
jgi:succinyldiaminopimelate transaminase